MRRHRRDVPRRADNVSREHERAAAHIYLCRAIMYARARTSERGAAAALYLYRVIIVLVLNRMRAKSLGTNPGVFPHLLDLSRCLCLALRLLPLSSSSSFPLSLPRRLQEIMPGVFSLKIMHSTVCPSSHRWNSFFRAVSFAAIN